MLCFFGGSLAYWQWTSNNEQKTSVALTVTEEFRCDVDGGGNISSEEKYLVPSDCMNSEYAIQRTITVNPTLFSNNTNVSNVTNMYALFCNSGLNASNWSLDLSGWNVNNVIGYTIFNIGIENKVISPIWVNEDQGDITDEEE